MSISKLHPQFARLRMWPVIARHREYSPRWKFLHGGRLTQKGPARLMRP
jgi:hypothetical protein